MVTGQVELAGPGATGETSPPAALARLGRSIAAVATGTAASGVLGLLFWVVAARLYTPAALGRDALLLAVAQTITAAADLNLNSSLPRLLPQLGAARARFVAGSYATVATTGTVAVAAFTLLLPYLPRSVSVGGDRWVTALALAGAVTIWGVFTLQENVLVAVRRAVWVPVESIAFGAGKILLVVVFHRLDVPHGVFLAWMLAAALLIIPINAFPVRSGLRGFGRGAALRIRGATPTRTVLLSFLAFDYGALLVQQACVLLLPLAVTWHLGPAANAAFTICFTCVLVAEAVLLGVANSLMVEAAADPDRADYLARVLARRTLAVVTVLAAATAMAAPAVLRVFGPAYAGQTGALRLLLLSAVPLSVLTLRVALWRLDGHGRQILALQALASAGVVSLLVPLLPYAGLTGVAAAWLGGQCVAAAVVVPSLVSRLAGGHRPETAR